jgi:GNAT superfamily N-acetyltransferase
MSPIDCLPLSQVPGAAPILARWFAAEWADHYAGRTLAEIEGDIPVVNGDGWPLILVARRGEAICGTAALRQTSIAAFSSLTPWLGGLYVEPSSRGAGVATALIAATESEARRRGFAHLNGGTGTAHVLFEKLGWTRVGDALQEGQLVAVHQRRL